ncbi:MAG: metallo-mystery pair system four-Cys motif protein [Sideroxydans sp.]|nr:metallo-mystery pair system four-Cys motif protein [Sideroxydans sp.]
MKASLPKFALSAVAASLMVACGGGGSTPTPAANTQAVTLNFDVVNGATAVGTTGCTVPMILGNASAVAPSTTIGTSGKMQDLRFYVSNPVLIDAAGNKSPITLTKTTDQDSNVALLDFETGSGTCATGTPMTNTSIVGTVAAGNYVGVEFDVGVPVKAPDGVTSLNHSDTVAATTPILLKWAAMAWSWQSGRKFTKFEFVKPAVPATAAASAIPAVTTMVHLGSTGCPVTALGVDPVCTSPNRAKVTFATGFNPATNKIALDLGSLFGGVNLNTSQTWMSGKVTGMMTANPAYYYGKFNLDIASGVPMTTAPVAPALFVIK